MSEEDIRPQRKINFQWDEAKAKDSLQGLYEIVHQDAENVIGWYLRSKKGKKLGARTLRVGTILAGTAAAITPILSEMTTTNGSYHVSPAWASIWLALAAALALLDRYFGLSSGWMRYVVTELEIRQLTVGFEMDWETLKATWGGGEPSKEQLLLTLKRFRQFVMEVYDIVRKETNEWRKEFEKTLSILDDSKKR